ncbi:MAG TPA: class I SAM-dependent rRNA methyltransferase [Candidatus Kapabacteria bacterium]
MYPKITIKNHHERRLLKGHLWAFSNELLEVPKDIPAGTIVTLIREFDKKPFAIAFYHPNSLIACRIISRNVNEVIDAEFFKKRIGESTARRQFLQKERNAVRLVHGESDLLPGLIVEKYNDIITFQITSAGMDARKDEINSALEELFHPRSIIEKNLSYLRKLEGLTEQEGFVKGTESDVEFHDGLGTKYHADILKSQKTGGYLDQMDNRTAIRRYIPEGATVLDLFTNTGGFALNMALAGAAEVTAVDQSEDALASLAKNAELNGVTEKIKTVHTDCFSFIKECKETFDVIVLDPPSLVRSKKELKSAELGYYTLHKEAIKCLRIGGILITASCSHHFTREMYLDCIRRASGESKRVSLVLEERGASADHPVHTMMPETEYLKLFVLSIA